MIMTICKRCDAAVEYEDIKTEFRKNGSTYNFFFFKQCIHHSLYLKDEMCLKHQYWTYHLVSRLILIMNADHSSVYNSSFKI